MRFRERGGIWLMVLRMCGAWYAFRLHKARLMAELCSMRLSLKIV